jgi:hypothetical protein
MRTPKLVIAFVLGLFLAISCPAPHYTNWNGSRMNVQGVLQGANSPVDLTLKIFSGDAGTNDEPTFVETHEAVVLNGNVFSVTLGSKTTGAIPLELFSYAAEYELEIQVGTDPPLEPRLALTRVAGSFSSFNMDGKDNTIPSIGAVQLRADDAQIDFGSSGLCGVGIDPNLTGINVSDPTGVRITGGQQLLFGPTDFCGIEVDPNGQMPGIQLRDPNGIRIINPDSAGAASLFFGSTDNCVIRANPAGALTSGLELRDPSGVRIIGEGNSADLFFGATNECSIGVDGPGGLTGIKATDPVGVRITGGQQLLFGPTDNCTIRAQADVGLALSDPTGIRLLNPEPEKPTRLLFGSTEACRIEVDPNGPTGLQLRDPDGIRIIGDAKGSDLFFGATNACSIGIDGADGLTGIKATDPVGVRIIGGQQLLFGPTDNCGIEVDPSGETPGLQLRDPNGVRIIGEANGADLFFGATNECSIGIDGADGLTGIKATDPVGVRITGGQQLLFGPTDNCVIRAQENGLVLSDPKGIRLDNNSTVAGRLEVEGNMVVRGNVEAWGVVTESSRHLKENIRPIDDALSKIVQLQGVYFDWKTDRVDKKSFGFIAEDVAEILPEAVMWDREDESARGVRYGQVVAVAIEGVKAQQSQIDALKLENGTLQQQNQDFRERLAHLESMVERMAKPSN